MTAPTYLDEHRGYIGTSGSGKSTTARVDVEKLLHERRHIAIIDVTGIWYGLRSDRAGTGPGFDIPIFGGRRGDVAFDAGDGRGIGKLVGDGISAIVDLSAMRDGASQRRFMADFIAAIREKPAGHFQLVCDEADEYVPEKGNVRDAAHYQVAEDMIWISKRGRTDGYVLSIITQRLADVAKAAFSQVQTIFAHQLTSPEDITAFGKYVKAHGTKEEFALIMKDLPGLQVGQHFLYRPRLHFLELDMTPLPVTFDSSRTPAPGEARREPKLLSQIDLKAIKTALAKSREEEAIAAYAAGAEGGQLLIERDGRIRELEDRVAELEGQVRIYDNFAVNVQLAVDDVREELDPLRSTARPAFVGVEGEPPPLAPSQQVTAGDGEAARPAAERPRAASPARKRRAAATLDASTGMSLTGAQNELLRTLAWWAGLGHPAPTRVQIAAKASWKSQGSHLRNRIAELGSKGLVHLPAPGKVSLTKEGKAVAPRPDLGETLLASLHASLTGAQGAVLHRLRTDRRTWTRKQLAEEFGWEEQGSHLRNRLAELKAHEIIEYPGRGTVKLQDWVR